MSFYVTLPSNSSSNSYNNNSTTYYRTDFQEPLEFQSEYEVAVAEAIYKLSWFLPIGNLIYSYTESLAVQKFEIIPITFHDGDTILKFLERVNLSIQEHIIIKKYNERYDHFLNNEKIKSNRKNEIGFKPLILPENRFPRIQYDLKNKSNNLFVINDIRTTEIEFKNAPMLKYSDENLFIQFLNKEHTLQFKGKISELLKTNDEEIWSSNKKEINFVNINNKGKINSTQQISLVDTLFVYTDIIDYQYVGSEKMPLLRNIVIDYNTTQKTMWVHYDFPHYFRVNKTSINTILIDIRDDNGNKISFDDGYIIIKLHFRPRKI